MKRPMHLNRFLRLASLTFTLAVLAAPAASAATLSAPPADPDATHVLNGCHLSSLRFLNRFLADYPAEHGQTLVVTMRNADGSVQAHTIALVSWQGQAWCRDEYYGVFSLDCAAEARPNLDRLSARAERKLERHAQLMVRTGQAAARREHPAQLSAEDNLRDVTTATTIIPYATTIYWVRCGHHEIPMAFFRPAANRIAVYDPVHGTSTANCSCPDDAKVVQLVAARLGYRADRVHAELSTTTGTLLALNSTSNTSAQ